MVPPESVLEELPWEGLWIACAFPESYRCAGSHERGTMLASTDSTASCSSPSCSVSQSDVNLPHFTSCGAGWQPRTTFSLHVSIAWLDNDWILSDDREKLKVQGE